VSKFIVAASSYVPAWQALVALRHRALILSPRARVAVAPAVHIQKTLLFWQCIVSFLG
jgi:hypothetical protein